MPIAELLASDWIREMSSSVGRLERSLEYVIAIFAPRDARSIARAEPIPREAPVTMALAGGELLNLEQSASYDLHLAFERSRLRGGCHHLPLLKLRSALK